MLALVVLTSGLFAQIIPFYGRCTLRCLFRFLFRHP